MYPSTTVVLASLERLAADVERVARDDVPGAFSVSCRPMRQSPLCECDHLPAEHRHDLARTACTVCSCARYVDGGIVLELRTIVRVKQDRG